MLTPQGKRTSVHNKQAHNKLARNEGYNICLQHEYVLLRTNVKQQGIQACVDMCMGLSNCAHKTCAIVTWYIMLHVHVRKPQKQDNQKSVLSAS